MTYMVVRKVHKAQVGSTSIDINQGLDLAGLSSVVVRQRSSCLRQRESHADSEGETVVRHSRSELCYQLRGDNLRVRKNGGEATEETLTTHRNQLTRVEHGHITTQVYEKTGMRTRSLRRCMAAAAQFYCVLSLYKNAVSAAVKQQDRAPH